MTAVDVHKILVLAGQEWRRHPHNQARCDAVRIVWAAIQRAQTTAAREKLNRVIDYLITPEEWS